MTPDQVQMMEEFQALLRSWQDRGVMIRDVAGLLLGSFCTVTDGHYTHEQLITWLAQILRIDEDSLPSMVAAAKGVPS